MKAAFISACVHAEYSTASEQLMMCWETTITSLRTYFFQWSLWWEIKEWSSVFHSMRKMLPILSRLYNTINRCKIWRWTNSILTFLFFFPLFLFHRLISLSAWSKSQNFCRMESFQFMWVAVILHFKISVKGKFDLRSLEKSWIVTQLLPASLLPCLTRGQFKSATQNEVFL